jgi:hypothetical protein
MNEDLESRLRAALRPVAPRAEFTQNLIARVTAGRRDPKAMAWWLSAGVAASLLVAAGVQYNLQARHDRESGLEARREVIEALRMTSQKLDLAYEAIKSESPSPADDKSGV